jgi:hypothetical protein
VFLTGFAQASGEIDQSRNDDLPLRIKRPVHGETRRRRVESRDARTPDE